jgi:hypothetical protein
MTKDEVLKLAKVWFEANTYGDEAVEVYEAIEQALAQPAQQEPFQPDWANFEEGRKVGRAEALERPPNCGTGYCSCIECFKSVK